MIDGKNHVIDDINDYGAKDMGYDDLHMKDNVLLEIDLHKSIKIWWSYTWRFGLVIVCSFIIAGIFETEYFESDLLLLATSYLVTLLASVAGVYGIINRVYNNFSLSLLDMKLNKVNLTALRFLKVYWSIIWRVIVIYTAFSVLSAIPFYVIIIGVIWLLFYFEISMVIYIASFFLILMMVSINYLTFHFVIRSVLKLNYDDFSLRLIKKVNHKTNG
ncbi:hypothetical protein [Alkaliphilus transvaalensis]|uniref:hypothetical protein n=1 Tax=Alkaliphilus transvaalensis TaxID=114628 RepID=UPI00047B5079|nr:hypothetical protein [Alkaliphilus transvaalensis]